MERDERGQKYQVDVDAFLRTPGKEAKHMEIDGRAGLLK